MLTRPARAMSVARASPTWVLWAHTNPFDPSPMCRASRSTVSTMWWSRTFHDSRSPRIMIR